MRRIFILAAAFVCVAGAAFASSPRPTQAHSARSAHHASKGKGTFRVCSHGKCHRIPVLSGSGVPASELRKDPLPRPSGDIWIRAENLNEEVKVHIYKPDGSFDDAALAQLDNLFRCVRSGEVRAVRPELYEQLSRIYDHFGGKEVVLISGFRFKERNSSRHYHASAMDIRIPGVPLYTLYHFAETLDAGGMGMGVYPTGQFIHVDFRAPGEPSYCWTDYSGHGGAKPHSTGRKYPARKPTS